MPIYAASCWATHAETLEAAAHNLFAINGRDFVEPLREMQEAACFCIEERKRRAGANPLQRELEAFESDFGVGHVAPLSEQMRNIYAASCWDTASRMARTARR